jgi:hypothetical protein
VDFDQRGKGDESHSLYGRNRHGHAAAADGHAGAVLAERPRCAGVARQRHRRDHPMVVRERGGRAAGRRRLLRPLQQIWPHHRGEPPIRRLHLVQLPVGPEPGAHRQAGGGDWDHVRRATAAFLVQIGSETRSGEVGRGMWGDALTPLDVVALQHLAGRDDKSPRWPRVQHGREGEGYDEGLGCKAIS